MATAVISARCTGDYLAAVDEFAASIGKKRGEVLLAALESFMSGKVASVAKGVKPTKANILAALAELGPSTCPEIGRHLGCSANQVSKRMGDMWKQGRVRVYAGDVRESEHIKGKMLDVWHIKSK